MKKTLDNVLTIVLVIVLVIMAGLSVMLIVSSANDGVADVFGYSPITVMDTKSMEPFFGSNDLVIVKKQDTTQLKKEDIISFWGVVDGTRCIITHRIHEAVLQTDGTYAYQTKGDNNDLVDQDPANTFRQPDIYPDDIIGVYVTHIPVAGAVVSFVKSPAGILVCLVIPLALLFLWQLVRVIRMAMAYNREVQAEKTAQMSEEEKQKVIEEYLRKQQEAQNEDSAPTTEEEQNK